MGLTGWDYLNFGCDERYKRRLNRKRVDRRGFEMNICSLSLKRALEDGRSGGILMDDDYRAYLTHLADCSESRPSVSEEDNGNGNDEDDADPQYKMFLEKLREDGKSYILEVAKINGIPILVRYEAQGGSDDECDLPTRRKLRNDTKREQSEAAKDLRNIQSTDKLENQKVLRSVLEDERNNSVVEKDSRPERFNPVSHGTEECSSQKLNPEDNRIPEAPTQRKLRNVTKGENTEAAKVLRNVQSKDKLENLKVLRSFPEKERENSVVEKVLRPEHVGPVSHGTKGCPSQKLSPEDNDIPELQCQGDTVSIIPDGCYQSFLNCMEREGDCVVFLLDSGKRLKYEEDDGVESSSDIEILEMENALYCGEGKYSPFVASRTFDAYTEQEDGLSLGKPSKNDPSQFRKKVMSILERPYDYGEYKDLWQQVKERKAMEGHRELRGGMVSYPADKYSQSYLDHYSDLKRKIDAAKPEQHKVLNLLRGFFFWLQNLSHEGAFQPWTDPSCLAVKPRTR